MKKQLTTLAIILAATSFNAIAAPAAPEWVRIVESKDGTEVWDGAVGTLVRSGDTLYGTFRVTLDQMIHSYYLGVQKQDCGKPTGKLRLMAVGDDKAVYRSYLTGEGSTISELGEALCDELAAAEAI